MLAGMDPSKESIQVSVLGIAKKSGLLQGIDYTEDFFYEEVLFCIEVIAEAQDKFGIIQKMVSRCESVLQISDPRSSEEIVIAMLAMAEQAARERMGLVGIRPVRNEGYFERLQQKRLREYASLLTDSISCPEPIPTENMTIGLEPRNHPEKVYLGQVADNLCEALGIGGLDSTALQIGLLAKYTSLLEVMNSTASE